MGGKNIFDELGDMASQVVYDAGLRTGEGQRSENPRGREEKKAKKKASDEKLAARKRLKVMPDPEAQKTASRKGAAKRRGKRTGRASTILSDADDKLGG